MKETILAALLAPIITAALLVVGWPIFLDYQNEVERVEIVRKKQRKEKIDNSSSNKKVVVLVLQIDSK